MYPLELAEVPGALPARPQGMDPEAGPPPFPPWEGGWAWGGGGGGGGGGQLPVPAIMSER